MERLIVIIFFLIGVGAVLAVVAASAPSASRTPNGRMAVTVFAPRGGPGPSCARVYPLRRTVSIPAVLTGAMRPARRAECRRVARRLRRLVLGQDHQQ